ncbi:MAG: UbiA-like polyprenyltransferase [Bacteroidota bacterium]
MLRTISKYLALIKFSHSVFAMPFAAIGFVAGLRNVDFHVAPSKALWVLGCMVFARSSAMAFNRWSDRHIDSKNARTAGREIPSGAIKANSALWFTIITALAFMFCAYQINELCFFLSPIALLVVLGYSLTKRFTALSHLVLGLGLSLAPVGAYLAVTGHFDWLPVMIGLAVITWVGGFDIIYALQDAEFDRQNHLHSIPAALGIKGALTVSRMLHVGTSLLLIIPFMLHDFGWIYFVGWSVFSLLLIMQHRIAGSGDMNRINLAFFTANGIASMVFMAFAVGDMLV